jgi:hypothetical protein
MRIVTIALLLVVSVGCGGKARHVVIHPDEVPGRRGDGWRITSEPAGAHRPAEAGAPAE